MNDRRILAQGDRDGACFLYAIANAVGALGMRQPSQKKWTDAVRSLPFNVVDYLAGRGTEKIDGKPDLLVACCREFVGALGRTDLEVAWKEGIRAHRHLAPLLTHDALFVMCVDDDAHWVTAVDADEAFTYVACSSKALERRTEYEEKASPRLERTYNRQATLPQLKVGKGYGLLISQ